MYPHTCSGQLKEFVRLRQYTDIFILLCSFMLCIVRPILRATIQAVFSPQVDLNFQFISRCITHKHPSVWSS